jgi:hypothetical protein
MASESNATKTLKCFSCAVSTRFAVNLLISYCDEGESWPIHSHLTGFGNFKAKKERNLGKVSSKCHYQILACPPGLTLSPLFAHSLKINSPTQFGDILT